MSIDLANIGSEVCEPVGGTSVTVIWGLHSDFDNIAVVKDICSDSGNAATNFEGLATINGNHTLKAGKNLHKITITQETGAIKSTQIGEKGRRIFENTLELEVPGSEAVLLGFSRFIKNQKIIAFVDEFGSGRFRQFGSKRLPAWVETQEGGLEAAIEGKNATVLTIKDKNMGPAPIYLGDLESLLEADSE